MAPEPSEPGERWPSLRALGAELLVHADEATRNAWRADFTDEARPPGRIVSSPRRMRAAPPAEATPAPPPPARTSISSARDHARTELACPPLPRPAGTSPFQIKGLPYRGFASFVSRVLPGGVDELADALDNPSLGEFLRQPFLASSRYDVLPLRPLVAAVARITGQPFADLVRATTSAQARYDARTVFRSLFGSATLDDWHERTTRFGSQYYTFGRFEGVREGQCQVRTTHEGVPEYLAPWYAPMQAAYAEEIVRFLGGKGVTSEVLPWRPAAPLDGLPTVITGTRVRWD